MTVYLLGACQWQYSCVEKVGTGCACAAMDETAIVTRHLAIAQAVVTVGTGHRLSTSRPALTSTCESFERNDMPSRLP